MVKKNPKHLKKVRPMILLYKAIQRIDIRSISGRLIQSISPTDMGNIDISSLTNGVYILELQTGTTTVYRKLVKR